MNYSWARYSLRKSRRSSFVFSEKSSLSLFAIVSDLSPEPALRMSCAALCTFVKRCRRPSTASRVALGFASLHSLYLLYTKLGEKANFGEVAIGEKIRRSCRTTSSGFLVSVYFVSRPRGLVGDFWAFCPKHTPVYCAYCTNRPPLCYMLKI